MGNVSAIQDGREKNVNYGTMNVKFPIAMDTVTVQMENVTVFGVIKGNSVRKVMEYFTNLYVECFK